MKILPLIPAFILSGFIAAAQPNPAPKSKHRYIVACHRGDHTVFPENSLQADAAAIKDGADYIEIDLRTTSDGQLVSMHDASTDRMTGIHGLIKDMTLQQVLALKLRPRTAGDTTTYRVPTFEQILQQSKDKIYIYIDFKEADATATLALLKKYGMEKQVLVYINKASQVTDWRKTYPIMPLMFSMPDSVKDVESMKKVIALYRPDILDGNWNTYTPEMVQLAASLQIPVWPDIQGPGEGPQTWDKAIALGLKGLQTDNPPALIKYLEGKGLR